MLFENFPNPEPTVHSLADGSWAGHQNSGPIMDPSHHQCEENAQDVPNPVVLSAEGLRQ